MTTVMEVAFPALHKKSFATESKLARYRWLGYFNRPLPRTGRALLFVQSLGFPRYGPLQSFYSFYVILDAL